MGNYLTGISKYDGPHRDIEINERTGSYEYVIMDDDFANHDRIRTYPDTIAYDWSPRSFASTLRTDGDPVTYVDV